MYYSNFVVIVLERRSNRSRIDREIIYSLDNYSSHLVVFQMLKMLTTICINLKHHSYRFFVVCQCRAKQQF